ncbi:MAG: NADH-quinone oxidoreductase subunit N [Anaerolineae bacterium]|nr:NADH-quinone oxidoreductase subunit N [Anaerolineae bacterium]
MAEYLLIMPEIILAVLAALIVIVDLRVKKKDSDVIAWLTFIGIALAFAATLVYIHPMGGKQIWGGMLRSDDLSKIFRLVFLFGAGATVLFAKGYEVIGRRGEFYILLVLSTLGMNLMGASADLIMLFVAIETASLPLYIMAGFMTDNERSIEAGFKYLLFGAMTSTLMLYGFSLLYGFAGTTDIYQLAQGIAAGNVPAVALVGSIVLVLIGFGFKISMVPFHFWAPDVYEGAPTPVTGFLSTASKAAGFAVVTRVLFTAFPQAADVWMNYVAVLSAVTMTLGNLVALRQTNIKRMLAYSSIAHAGYILMGIAAGSQLGITGVVYYVAVYLLTNLAAFGIVVVYYNQVGSDEIKDYAGMSRRSPGLAFAMLLLFLSLGGIPPLGGFIGKVLVFAAAVKAGLVWLAVIGVLNAVVGLYYYLIVLKVVYLHRQEGDEAPLAISRAHSWVLAVCTLGVFLTGTVLLPVFRMSTDVALSLF